MEIIEKFANKEFLPGLIYLFLLLFFYFLNPFVKKYKIDLTMKRVWGSIIFAFILSASPIIFHIVFPQYYFLPNWFIILVLAISISITVSIFLPYPHEFIILYVNGLITRQKNSSLPFNHHNFLTFLLFSSSSRVRYYRMIMTYYTNIDDLDKAYDALGKMHEISLFPFEQILDIHAQIMLFLKLGNIRKAELLWSNAPVEYKEKNDSKLPLAQFYRNKADFDTEYQVLYDATQIIKPDTSLLAQVYNNLAVNAVSRGNDSDKLLYYKKAKNAMIISNSLRLKHIVFPNLIDTYLLMNMPEEAALEFAEYQKLINQNVRHDQICFYNYKFTYYRQKNDLQAIEETLAYGKQALYPTFNHEEQLNLKICELRIRWNNGLSGEHFLLQIVDDIEEYLSLPFPACFFAAKEIFHVIKGLVQSNSENPVLKKTVIRLQKFASYSMPLIEKKLIHLPNDLSSIRRDFLSGKIWLARLTYYGQCDQDYLDFVNTKVNCLEDILDLDHRAGNLLDEIDSHLNISDEIVHQLFDPPSSGFYMRPGFFEVRDQFIQQIAKHNQIALEKLSLFRYDITVLDQKLRLAWYFLKMGELNNSRQLFSGFQKANLSINHYADWIRLYYSDLCQAFPN